MLLLNVLRELCSISMCWQTNIKTSAAGKNVSKLSHRDQVKFASYMLKPTVDDASLRADVQPTAPYQHRQKDGSGMTCY